MALVVKGVQLYFSFCLKNCARYKFSFMYLLADMHFKSAVQNLMTSERKMSIQPPPALIASTIGPCPTIEIN